MFEVPLHNRLARSRYERYRSELRQISSELRSIVDNTLLEVGIAIRGVRAAHRDILAHYRSMNATRAEVEYLEDRWRHLPGDDRSLSFTLEELLRAQDRLADAEFRFVESQVACAMAQVHLKQAMGILLSKEELQPGQPAIPINPSPLPPGVNRPGTDPPPEQLPESAEPTYDPITRLPPISGRSPQDTRQASRRLPEVR